MALNYAKLRNVTALEIISALIRDGFMFDRGSGFHQIYYHPDGRRVSVTFHAPSATFTRKTLKSMKPAGQKRTSNGLSCCDG